MRLIDEKWKLFGIVNIFDLFVLCAAAFLIFFSFKWFMIADDPSFIKAETTRIKCKGNIQTSNYQMKAIKEGDVMLDEKGNVICKIEKILSVEPAQRVVYQSKDGEKIFLNSDMVNIEVVLVLTVYKRGDELYFVNLGCPIIESAGIHIKSKKYTVYVNITEFLGSA